MMPLAFILHYPWGLFDKSARTPLNGASNFASANWPFLLATTSDFFVRLGNRRVPPQPEGVSFKWSDYFMRLHSLPAVTQNERRNFVVSIDRHEQIYSHFPIDIRNSIARPKERNGDEDWESAEAGKLIVLLKTMFHIVNDIIDAADDELAGKKILRLSWEKVAKQILHLTDESDEPQMDLIVKHAQDLHKTVSITADRPRRVLNRVRRMMPVTKIQELDSACLTDYIRRPGITPAQKAGARQELLGIDRQELFDTVENRVLKDFLKRSQAASQNYLRAFGKFKSSNRLLTVKHYGLACRRLFREAYFEKVSAISSKPTPNYVLLFDPSYHKIWKAYEELLKLETKEDDAWRWQSRLWSDINRVFLHTSLLQLPKRCDEIPAISPLYVNREQLRGRWTKANAQSAFILLNGLKRQVVAAPIDVRTESYHPKVMPWQRSLGPTMVIHFEEVGSKKSASILVWTIHSTGTHPPDIGQAVTSAEHCLKMCCNYEQTHHDLSPSVRGIVLQSSREIDAPPQIADLEIVTGISFSPLSSFLSTAIALIGERIERFVSELFK